MQILRVDGYYLMAPVVIQVCEDNYQSIRYMPCNKEEALALPEDYWLGAAAQTIFKNSLATLSNQRKNSTVLGVKQRLCWLGP